MKNLFPTVILLLATTAGAVSTPLVVVNAVAGSANWVQQSSRNAGCDYIVKQIQGTLYPADKTSHFKSVSDFTFEADGSKTLSKSELELAISELDNAKFTTAWFEAKGILNRMFYTSDTPNYVYYTSILNAVDDTGISGSIVCINVFGLRP